MIHKNPKQNSGRKFPSRPSTRFWVGFFPPNGVGVGLVRENHSPKMPWKIIKFRFRKLWRQLFFSAMFWGGVFQFCWDIFLGFRFFWEVLRIRNAQNVPFWSNYSDFTRPHPKWWFTQENPLISNLGWWNIIIWPDLWKVPWTLDSFGKVSDWLGVPSWKFLKQLFQSRAVWRLHRPRCIVPPYSKYLEDHPNGCKWLGSPLFTSHG